VRTCPASPRAPLPWRSSSSGLLGNFGGRRSSWPLWGAAVFGLIGVAQLSGRLVNMPSLGALLPVLIIIVGVIVLLNARRAPAG
jgi:hypothetical protein